MKRTIQKNSEDIQEKLLLAASELFMAQDYNKVTTRLLAQKAGTSTSMIQYYFSGKQNLYEEMIKQKFKIIDHAFNDSLTEDGGLDFEKLLQHYYRIHHEDPNFPVFLINILAYKNGPGFVLVTSILDKKRDKIQKILLASQNKNLLGGHVNIDVLRILMMSMSLFPFLIQGVLGQSENMQTSSDLLKNVMAVSGKSLAEYARPKNNHLSLV